MKKIFIDCGSHKYEISDGIIKNDLFDEYHLFEANKDLVDYEKYKDNPKVKVYWNAIWIEDKEIEFFLSKEYTTGSTLNRNKITSSVDYETPQVVPAINFSKWLKENTSKEDYIQLKMDIEGAEFDVLEHMKDEDTISWIDDALIEFHQHKIKEPNINKRYKDIIQYFKSVNVSLKEHY